MQFTPLRPRRRRNAAPAAPPRPDTASAGAGLSAVAARIAGLIDGPVTEALAVMLTELYGDALARIIDTVGEAPGGQAILDRLCSDQLIGGLLVVHDLHPHPLERRVDRALSAALDAAPNVPSVALDRIEDDVVYVRLAKAAGPAARSAIARAIAEAAPEISRVCAEVYAEDGHVALA